MTAMTDSIGTTPLQAPNAVTPAGRKRMLILLSNFPLPDGEAIEVVSFEIARLMSTLGYHVQIQVIIRDKHAPSHLAQEQRSIPYFAKNEVRFLKTLYLGDLLPKPSPVMNKVYALWDFLWSLPILRRRINPRLFPAMRLTPALRQVVQNQKPDVILSVWSWESLAAVFSIRGVPKFFYYGNPDHKPPEARLRFPELFSIPSQGWLNRIALIKKRMVVRALEVQHIKMMKTCEITANNSELDAAYYRAQGHARSIYVPFLWPEAKSQPAFGGDPSLKGPHKILASVGNLGATGNTFGLHYLGNELAPRLEAALGSDQLSFEVLGGGMPTPLVKKVLSRPTIHLRGWVTDIESHILQSKLFLVLTNVNGFVVGNTRILLAWSLGACVIAHRNNSQSIPEIVHNENALLADTTDEMVSLITQALRDPALRQRIGENGLKTYKQHFSSVVVVPRMAREMQYLFPRSVPC